MILNSTGQIYNSIIDTIEEVDEPVKVAIEQTLNQLWNITDWKFKEINEILYITTTPYIYNNSLRSITTTTEYKTEVFKVNFLKDYVVGENYFYDDNTNKLYIKPATYIITAYNNKPIKKINGDYDYEFTASGDKIAIDNEYLNRLFINTLKDLTIVNLLQSQQDENTSAYKESYMRSLNMLYKECGSNQLEIKEFMML